MIEQLTLNTALKWEINACIRCITYVGVQAALSYSSQYELGYINLHEGNTFEIPYRGQDIKKHTSVRALADTTHAILNTRAE